jgi:hypothetical protein
MKCDASELVMTSAAWIQPFGAGTLDLHLDSRIFRLERLGELLADRKIHRRIQDHLGFLARGLDQFGRDRCGRRRRGAGRGGEHGSQRQRRGALQRALQNVAP